MAGFRDVAGRISPIPGQAVGRLPLLIQLPGISLISVVALLAAIGDTLAPARKCRCRPLCRCSPPGRRSLRSPGWAGTRQRPDPPHRRHTCTCAASAGVTKAGRWDIRATLVEAAPTAVQTHAHWQKELARLEPGLGKPKAIVAIARKSCPELVEGCWWPSGTS
ncbi:MAG: hypothetical protein AB1801_02945 [Chloroflexota bacterium]